MDDNFLDDDLFDDAPFQFFEFADSFFGAPSATSFTLTRHGPFHTTRSNLLPRLPLPTLTPRLSTTATVSSLVATAPVAARQQVPANFSSTTPQRQTNLPSLSFSTARRDLLPVTRVANPLSTAPPSAINREPNSDDYYLNQLATQDFSGPSLPSRSPCPSGRSQDSGNQTNPSSLWNPGVAALSGADILRRADQLVTGPSFGNRQTEPRANPQDPSCPRPQPPSPNMPPATRRKRRSGGASDGDSDLIEVSPPAGPSRRSPRTRTTRNTPQQTRPVEILDSDDVFGSPSLSTTRVRQSTVVPKEEKDLAVKKRKRDLFESDHDPDGSDGEDIPVVNLADTETVPESILKQQKSKNEVKLSTFQCVICMDDCTDLTVTHCGHLFCSECLHSSLHIDVTKKVCPICRQSIETKPASGRFTAKQKGYYHLELKLLTKKTLGRRTTNTMQQ